MLQIIEFGYMLAIDIVFILVLVLIMLPLGIWRQAAFAVMKRNFSGYFSSPTGYVFLCLFVLLTSFAAFWPHEFFTTNLANLDQLNQYLPYIMLIFIPAITMSIWAEERRQGTDELLLTLPAKDFDIVIGKYFAAVLVFTVSLLFSQLSNYAVLIAMTGGQLDSFLLFSTYLGYWWMGIAMLSLGMVASFLTNNLTVGFIFGAAFNAPLAFFSNADVILSNSKWIQRLFDWSLLQRFEPFGRGLISLPSALYFLGLVVIGIYLSLILIGRRHWLGGRDGTSMLSHFVVRGLFLFLTMVALVLIAQHSPLNRVRADVSANKVSTLSPSTLKVLNELTSQTTDENGKELPPIKIDAYVSNNVPTEYVQTKQNLVNLLREFDVLGGNRVQLNLRQGIEPFSQEAINAEKRFGIRPNRVSSQSRGAVREEEVVLGVAFSSGRERVVTRFLPYGMPVEYELMRSINTVAKSERKRIAIVETDAYVTGANLRMADSEDPYRVTPLRVISELLKQYDVELVRASEPIPVFLEDDNGKPTKRRFDAMMVVQPSKMSDLEIKNVVNAIQLGQPTAIFEDPLPNRENFAHIPGTFYPRILSRTGGKPGEIQELWDALDLNIYRTPFQGGLTSGWIVWQRGNPYPRNQVLDIPEHVILNQGQDNPSERYFDSEHPATRGINQLYFQYAGYLQPVRGAKLKFRDLVVTGNAGRMEEKIVNPQNPELANTKRGGDNSQFVIAAEIKGGQELTELPEKIDQLKPDKKYTNVIYVSDIDVLADLFVELRDNPIRNSIQYRFQNMSFVLNTIDALAGEDIYQDIRNRRERHVTLKVVENTTDEAMDELHAKTQELEKDFVIEEQKAAAEAIPKFKEIEKDIDDLKRRRDRGEKIDPSILKFKEQALESTKRAEAKKLQAKREELNNQRQDSIRSIRLDAELKIQEIQRKFKLAAVVIPPVPPLIVGLIVFARRRLREREGISKARRLK
jgi:ABC-2 type transport system permease protein